MGFTPVSGNLGGTHLLADGATKVTTRRFDNLFTEQDIYFLKLDMEGAEKHSVGPGKPMDKWFRWGGGPGGEREQAAPCTQGHVTQPAAIRRPLAPAARAAQTTYTRYWNPA